MDGFLTYALLLCLVVIILFREVPKFFSNKNYPKGPFGLPVVGHLPLFGQSPPLTFMKWWRKNGDVYQIQLGGWKTIVVNGYRAVKAAAEHRGDVFSGRPNFVLRQVKEEIKGEDSFAFGNFNPTYLKQRKLATTALRKFTTNRQQLVEELVVEEANAFADKLKTKYETVPGYVEFNIQTLTVRAIYQFLYGRNKHVDVEKHVKVIANYLHYFNKFSTIGSAIN